MSYLCTARRSSPFRLLLVLLAMLLSACGQTSDPVTAEQPATGTPTSSGSEGLPPALEKVPCDQLVEWIRFRPLSKACTRDSDCVLQRDACCDETAVNVTYSTACSKTCKDECPQDSPIGQRLVMRAVCKQGACDLETQARPAQ